MPPSARVASDTSRASSRTRHKRENVQKVDRRVQRTQRQLREALLTLMFERGWDAVTVGDICARADLGRSTFYLHFADKESLLLSGFDTLHAELAALPRDPRRPFGFVEPLVTHALENQRLFFALVGRQSFQQMQWHFRDVVITLLTAELAALAVPAPSRATLARFLAGGLLEHLLEALESRSRVRAAHLATTFRKLALGVVRAA